MRDKVILGITLTVVLLLTLLIYTGGRPAARPAAQAQAREKSVTDGQAHLRAVLHPVPRAEGRGLHRPGAQPRDLAGRDQRRPQPGLRYR